MKRNLHYAPCLLAVSVVGLLASCAHTPKTSIGYYYSKANLSLTVTRTVACDGDKKPIFEAVVEPTLTYGADYASGRQYFDLAQSSNAFSNTTVKFDFYDDGRLKAVNATSEGQGTEILKSISSVIGAFGLDQSRQANVEVCKHIASRGKEGVLTMTYVGTIDLSDHIKCRNREGNGIGCDGSQLSSPEFLAGFLREIEPTPGSKLDHEMTKAMFGRVCSLVYPPRKFQGPVSPIVAVEGTGKLAMREPAVTEVRVFAGDTCFTDQYWLGQVLDGENGSPYVLPVPKSAAFGGTGFTLAVGDSGLVTSLEYKKDTGVGKSADGLKAVLDAFAKPTDKDKAAKINEQVELIIAQERLVKCRADRKECK